jgi:hypothetical protein
MNLCFALYLSSPRYCILFPVYDQLLDTYLPWYLFKQSGFSLTVIHNFSELYPVFSPAEFSCSSFWWSVRSCWFGTESSPESSWSACIFIIYIVIPFILCGILRYSHSIETSAADTGTRFFQLRSAFRNYSVFFQIEWFHNQCKNWKQKSRDQISNSTTFIAPSGMILSEFIFQPGLIFHLGWASSNSFGDAQYADLTKWTHCPAVFPFKKTIRIRFSIVKKINGHFLPVIIRWRQTFFLSSLRTVINCYVTAIFLGQEGQKIIIQVVPIFYPNENDGEKDNSLSGIYTSSASFSKRPKWRLSVISM